MDEWNNLAHLFQSFPVVAVYCTLITMFGTGSNVLVSPSLGGEYKSSYY
jgi:hypothetical protein